MAIAFTQAPLVAAGDSILWWQRAALALAFNDRLRSGIADGPWRIFFYLFSMFRQIRNSDGLFSFPRMAEFFEFWQGLDPATVQWPSAGPGDPEGSNIACQIVQWIAGNGGNLLPESERVFPIDTGDPATVAAGWALAKVQRGAVDLTTGAMSAPALDVARARYNMAFSLYRPHGNSYGGFAPTPLRLGVTGDCEDETSDTAATPNYEIFFTNLETGATVTYPGTCPMGGPVYDDPTHVAWVYPAPWGYYVRLNSGQTDFYPISQWIIGPFKGGNVLTKQPNQLMERVLNAFAGEFRGSDAQRAGRWNLNNAFDTQDFLDGHYRLAPQYGQQSGESIYEIYPLFKFGPGGSTSAGNKAKYEGATDYAFHDGFVCAGFRFTSAGISSGGLVEIRDGETVISEVSFTGNDDRIIWLSVPRKFALLNVRVGTGFNLGATGTVALEFLETLDYHPGIEDLALVCRMGAATDAGGMDGRGIDCTFAKRLWQTYSSYGCMVAGFLPIVSSSINENSVYDTARRLSKFVRCVPRENLLKYAVVDGKSICWFARYAAGVSSTAPNDIFDGIAQGIVSTAPAGGETNEWLMSATFAVYHPSESSLWKTDAYADYFPIINRCLFRPDYSPPIPADVMLHTGYGDKFLYSPEAPSGYNYIEGMNAAPDVEFYKSCRLYEPDPEIESVTLETITGVAAVKLTFKTRFHHCSTAPAAISDDISTWTDDLGLEPHRTMENGIREYILRNQTGRHCTHLPGDSADNSTVWTDPDNPFGACYPHFLFTKLIPLPHVQTGRPYSEGTDFMHDPCIQMDLYLRAMCEGYVDGMTVASQGCQCDDTANPCALYDYTYENLCYDALGNRWFSTVENPAGTNVQGFGPLPATLASAAVFNAFAKCINKLDKARVMLPFVFQFRTITYENDKLVDAFNADGTPAAGCTDISAIAQYWDGVPAEAGTQTADTGWVDETGIINATVEAYPTTCNAGQRQIHTKRLNTSWRVKLENSDQLEAIPESWRDMEETSFGIMATMTTYSATCHKALVPIGAGTGASCNSIADYWNCDGTQSWSFPIASTDPVITCTSESAGDLIPATLGSNSFKIGIDNLGNSCMGGGDAAINTIALKPQLAGGIFVKIPLVAYAV